MQNWRVKQGVIHTTLFVFLGNTAFFWYAFLTLTMKPRYCLYLLWLLAGSVRAQANRPPVMLRSDATSEVSMRGHLTRFVDSTGQLSIRQVIDRRQMGQFQPAVSLTDRQDFGYNTTATHWLYFELATPAHMPKPVRLMLEIKYANIDELELLEVSHGNIRSLGLTGNHFVFGQRPYRNNNYVFPIQLRAGQTAGYYLRLRQPYAILSFFVRLWHRPAFLASDRSEYFLWGMFVGIICIVAVLNLVMLLALRDWIYFWYSLYLHFITMHLFSDAGLGFQYLWPTFPRLNDYLPVYLYVWAAMVAQLTFMQYFIRQNRHNSRIFRWVNGFKALVTVALAAALTVQWLAVPGREQYLYRVVSLTTSCFVLVVTGLAIFSLLEPGRRTGNREPMVRYYGYALAVQFMGYGLVATINFCQGQGWVLPFDVETYVVLGLTVLVDLVFFTYGLAYRYNHAQQRNQQLELNVLLSRQEAQQRVIQSLEDERRRLAQDLHDDIGPLLATTKGYLSRLARTGQIIPLQQAQRLLDEAADELRTLAHQLLPRALEQSDLVSAISEASRVLSRRGIPVEFVSAGQVRPLVAQREQLVFSIATQLIRNAQRHPRVTDVTVQLLYHDVYLTLSVEDNGLPTPIADTDRTNLRAKADLLKAELLIDTTDDGNSVMLSVFITNSVPA